MLSKDKFVNVVNNSVIISSGFGAENFAVLRHIALNLLKHETSAKVEIKAKRLQVGWDNRYLLRVLQS